MQINATVEIEEEYVIDGSFFAGRDEVVTRETFKTCIASKAIGKVLINRDRTAINGGLIPPIKST